MIRLSQIACLCLVWLPIYSAALADEPAVAVPQTREAIALRNLHRLEKAFLVRACQLDDAQKRQVQELDHDWIAAVPRPADGAAARLRGDVRVELQGGVVRDLGQAAAIVGRRAPSDRIESATSEYRTSLRKKFRNLLTPEQRQVYDEELAARDDFKRQADAEALVNLLDEALDLTPEQCEGLTTTLKEWPDKDRFYIGHFFQRQGYLPVIPEELLAKHLTPEQVSLYRNHGKAIVRSSSALVVPQHEAFGE